MDFNTLKNLLVNQEKEELREPIEDVLIKKRCSLKDETEKKTFIQFVELLQKSGVDNHDLSFFSKHFMYNYILPQIEKEFDLVRFGSDFHINIELKSESTVEKQLNQLKKNHNYFKVLDTPTRYFSISIKESSILEYSPEDDDVHEVHIHEVWECIKNQDVLPMLIEEVNKLFSPKKFLISPLNDVDKMLENEYYLTDQQSKIVKYIKRESGPFFLITGDAGSGKSLVLYDLFINKKNLGKKCLMVHCGKLNTGHLKYRNLGYEVVSVKTLMEMKHFDRLEEYDYIFIDEAQKFHENQRNQLYEKMQNTQTKIVFCMDEKQIMTKKEELADNKSFYEKIIKECGNKLQKLNGKIRCNEAVRLFIEYVLEHPGDKQLDGTQNINYRYFDDKHDAEKYLRKRADRGTKVLNFTLPVYPNESDPKLSVCKYLGNNSHDVIGQEFNEVVVYMDSNFYYETVGKNYKRLCCPKQYYDLKNMLYVNLSRAREQIEIVIIDNMNLFLELAKTSNEGGVA